MSRRHFTRDNLSIVAGWDAPLNRYFLQIWQGENLEGDDYLFNGMPGLAMTITDVASVLHNWAITPPPTLFDDLRKDREFRDMGSHSYT